MCEEESLGSMFPAKKAFFFTHPPWLQGCTLHTGSVQDAYRRSKSQCILAYSQVFMIPSMPVSFSGQNFVLFSSVFVSVSGRPIQTLSYSNNLSSTRGSALKVPAKRSHIATPETSGGARKHTDWSGLAQSHPNTETEVVSWRRIRLLLTKWRGIDHGQAKIGSLCHLYSALGLYPLI